MKKIKILFKIKDFTVEILGFCSKSVLYVPSSENISQSKILQI